MVAKLDAMLSSPPSFDAGTYGVEIHEMTEMALADFGQYAHSNQPVHNVLWMYFPAGAAGKGQSAVHRVLNELYGPTPRGLPGDEDNGEMCAWFIFAALGLYPSCPGSADYMLGLPWIAHIRVRRPDGRDLTINTDPKLLAAPATPLARRIDGRPHAAPTIAHTTLANVGQIDVEAD
jgi:putative alpha-1,2-mannosidase